MIRRPVISLIIAAAILILAEVPAMAVDGDIHVGNHILTQKFRHKSEGYYLPLTETVEQFGMSVEVKDDKVIIQNTHLGDLRIPLDAKKIDIHGKSIDIGYPPIKRDGIVFYPLIFFEDVLGFIVYRDEKENIFISRSVEIGNVAPDGVQLNYPYDLSYSDFELDDGDSIRLVVDLDGAVLQEGSHDCSGIDDDFMNFRASQFARRPDVVRVVLELRKNEGAIPKYKIDRKSNGLWIGLKPNSFKVGFQSTDDGCVAEIRGARYDRLQPSLDRTGGAVKLVLDFEGARFPEGTEIVSGIGSVSRARIADHDGAVRIVFDLLAEIDYVIEELPNRTVKVTFKGIRGDLDGRVIVIDPGHGGRDPGAVKNGVQEKDLNLEMSLWLADKLRSYGATVYLTRTADIYLSLEDRLEYARHRGADLFVCVHTNATRQPETEIHGPMVILDELCDYRVLADITYDEMVKQGGREGIGVHLDDRGLYILRHRGDVPVLLIEAAFMTNADDLKLLTQPEGQFKRCLMDGVATAILKYYTGNFIAPPAAKPPGEAYGIDSSLFHLVDEEGLGAGPDDNR